MINKLNEDWDKIVDDASRSGPTDPAERAAFLGRIDKVGGALRKIAQGSVTRTTLSQAVRDSLEQILRADRDAIFPDLPAVREELSAKHQETWKELAQLRDRLDELRASFLTHPGAAGAAAGLEARHEIGLGNGSGAGPETAALLDRRLEELRADLRSQLERTLQAASGGINGRFAALESRIPSPDVAAAKEASRITLAQLAEAERRAEEKSDGRVREAIAAAEKLIEKRIAERSGERLARAVEAIEARQRAELEARIVLVEGKLAGGIEESRRKQEELRQKMESIMSQIDAKLDSLADRLGQVQVAMPPPAAFESVEERLVRLETRLRTVSDQVETVGVAIPEIRSLAIDLAEVRGGLGGLSGDLQAGQKEARESMELFSRRVQELQDLLRGGMEAWQASRASVRQSLQDLRDSLRDQLLAVSQRQGQPRSGVAGVLEKISGKSPGQHFGNDEWERFRARLETVVDGLESLLAESR